VSDPVEVPIAVHAVADAPLLALTPEAAAAGGEVAADEDRPAPPAGHRRRL